MFEYDDTFYELHASDPAVQSYNDFSASAGRYGRKLDHIMVQSGAFDITDAWIDRTMFTGTPGTAVSCPTAGCAGSGYTINTNLFYYSDHWAVGAKLTVTAP